MTELRSCFATRWSGVLWAVWQICLLTGLGCHSPVEHESRVDREAIASSSPRLQLSSDSPINASSIRFANVTAEAGIDFTYYGGPSAERFMTEQNGGGIGLLDFDGDGQLDIFLPNGSHFTRPAQRHDATHHLYQAQGAGRLAYVDVSAAAGLAEFGFGMGCAVGDYDNDGFDDLFLTQYGKNRLWHNNGDGTFTDVTDEAGVGDERWGTSAAFADLDGDGNLDLYVVNYVEWSPDDPPCYTQHQTPIRISCGPIGRTGQPDVLYHNRADGTFADVSDRAGIIQPEAKGLGLVIADFDADGRLDIYVANDTTENHLFLNQGDMRFQEVGIGHGVAVGSDGLAHSGMGVACGDVNRDGRFDLFVTNFDNEVNDLYLKLDGPGFSSANTMFGLDAVSRPMLGFGTILADFDADGFPDLFVANGHVWDLTSMGLNYTYAMPAQLIRNQQGQRFVDRSTSAGPYFQQPVLGRAVASGDLDRDGDEDLVITHLQAPAVLLRNDSERVQRTCRLRVIGRDAARQPLGCRVEVLVQGERKVYWIPSGGSFQSSSDSQLIITVGQATIIDEVTVHWPSGSPETWGQLPLVEALTLIQAADAGS